MHLYNYSIFNKLTKIKSFSTFVDLNNKMLYLVLMSYEGSELHRKERITSVNGYYAMLRREFRC